MRIAVDATAIGSGLGGDETLVRALLRGLAWSAQPDDSFAVLASRDGELPAAFARLPAVELTRIDRRGGVTHFSRSLPTWLRSIDPVPDVVLTNTHAPLRSPAPVVLMVPDLSFEHSPSTYPWRIRLRLKTLVPRQARSAAGVLTISDFCRDDLIRSYGLAGTRVAHVPLVIDEPIELDDDRMRAVRAELATRGVEPPYVLYLGNLHPRKNVARALRVFLDQRAADERLQRWRFVVAGAHWWNGSAEEEAVRGTPEGAVVFLGRVSDQEREVLLRDADLLVYLSLFEGFGLPPLEAMARGTAVLASDRTSIPEVCGDAAVIVSPEDDALIGGTLRELLLDDQRRAALANEGRARADSYTVAATGAALREALERGAGKTAPRAAVS